MNPLSASVVFGGEKGAGLGVNDCLRDSGTPREGLKEIVPNVPRRRYRPRSRASWFDSLIHPDD